MMKHLRLLKLFRLLRLFLRNANTISNDIHISNLRKEIVMNIIHKTHIHFLKII